MKTPLRGGRYLRDKKTGERVRVDENMQPIVEPIAEATPRVVPETPAGEKKGK